MKYWIGVLLGVALFFGAVHLLSRVPEMTSFQTSLQQELITKGSAKVSDHTDFEWDRIVLVSSYSSSMFHNWGKIGYPWLGYIFIPGHGADDAWYEWIFLEDGRVVAYGPVRHVIRMDREAMKWPQTLSGMHYLNHNMSSDTVLELQTWDDSPLGCRHYMVIAGTQPSELGTTRLDSFECPVRSDAED